MFVLVRSCLDSWILKTEIISHSYNLRVEDLSVVGVALHRSAAVTVGVVWAALVSRYWWPSEARRELSRALGELSVIKALFTQLVSDDLADSV